MKNTKRRYVFSFLFLLLSGLPARCLWAESSPSNIPVAKSVMFLPEGDLFRPLLADPKQPQFYMSFLSYRSSISHFTAWTVGFGETIGLVRLGSDQSKADGLQLNIMAGVLALFNWSSDSRDLINADYIIGPTVTYNRKSFGARLRLYHQSSHLGDELLLSTPIARINLSYEALDLIGDWRWRHTRLYGGGGVIVARDPGDLKRKSIEAGAEFLGASTWFQWLRPVAAMDIKWADQQNWYRNISLKAGWELGSARFDQRHIRLLLEFYNGFVPYGQFYNAKAQYIGAGFYIAL